MLQGWPRLPLEQLRPPFPSPSFKRVSMRINLDCPYAEKDQAKALGARWDGKTWYIIDVEDLTPFMRWIHSKAPEPVSVEMITLTEYLRSEYGSKVKALSFAAAKAFGIPYPPPKGWAEKYAHRSIRADQWPKRGKESAAKHKKTRKPPAHKSAHHGVNQLAPVVTKSVYVPHCGCYHVPPWEDCEHTEAAANAAMREMLALA